MSMFVTVCVCTVQPVSPILYIDFISQTSLEQYIEGI